MWVKIWAILSIIFVKCSKMFPSIYRMSKLIFTSAIMHYILTLYGTKCIQELNHNSASSRFTNSCFLFLSSHFLRLGLFSFFLMDENFHYIFIRRIITTWRKLEGSWASDFRLSITYFQPHSLLNQTIVFLIQFAMGHSKLLLICISPPDFFISSCL